MRSGDGPASHITYFFLPFILLCILNSQPCFAQALPKTGIVPQLDVPIEIQADRLEYQKEEDRYEAEGSVEVLQGNRQLKAHRVILNNKTGEAQISGNFSFFDGENTLEGEGGALNFRSRKGKFYNSRLLVQPEGYRIQGEVLEKFSEDRYRLEGGWFTTCECEEDGTPDWRFRMKRMQVQLEGYLVAEDVTFYVKKLPILYLPWVIYPAKRERQTGLLIPRFGYSSIEGIKYLQPLFWAMNPHMDATVTLDVREERGVGGGVEYRYKLSQRTEGELNTFFFHDTEIQQDRLDVSFNHRQAFSSHFKGRMDVRYVNDDSFFRDLSEFTEERSQRSLESNLTLTYGRDTHFAYLLGRYTQDLNSTSDQTLQTLPEVGYSMTPFRLGSLPVFVSFQGKGNHFWRKEGTKARRLDLAPSIFSRFELFRGVVVVPSIGFRETLYTRDQNSAETGHREFYWISLRGDTKIAKDFMLGNSFGLERVRHQIEPSVRYEFVERNEQSIFPFFDELETADPQHRVTYSLSQRLVTFYHRADQEKTLERLQVLSVKFTQSYNIKTPSVPLINGNPEQKDFSDLRGELSVKTPWPLTLGVDSFLDPQKGRWKAINSDLRFNLMGWWNLNIGHRFTQTTTLPQRGDFFNPTAINQQVLVSEIHFMTLQTTMKLPYGFTLANRAYYDLDRHEKTEIVYGVQYESQCWSVAFAFQDLPDEEEYSFMISLKGTGTIESGLLHRLFFMPE